MTEVWALPGYDVQAMIGYGASGEVWRARELATGDAVALKRLREDADPAAVAALRREASLLRSLDTPYVVRLRAVLGEGADTVLVLDLAGGGSLAALLARRGSLDPGEVITIAAPLAQALASAHACGLVHGDVTPSNILFTTDGMPLLADLGLTRLSEQPVDQVEGTADYLDPAVAAGGQPDAASDVWGLAAVCHHLLAGTPPHDGSSAEDVLAAARAGARAPLGLLAPTAPRQLVAAVEQALVADPAARPDAAAFAGALRRAHAAAPVRFHGEAAAAPGPAARPTHAVHSVPVVAAPAAPPDRRWRKLALAVAAFALLAAAALVGWLSGRGGATADLASVTAAATTAAPSYSPSPRPVASPARAAVPQWATVLDALDAQRAAAFSAADAGVLTRIYAPTSRLLAADKAAIAGLRAAGQSARGVRHTVRSITTTSYDGRSVVLRVVDVLAPYDVVDRTGKVVQRTAPRGEKAFSVSLVRTAQGWRLLQVLPA
ncbi:MAG: eukaryotic-like serine/threonine-protein kinase [Actinomycetota bacterium]|nr:eukaryotic-like serine/threonine-protein kinase [Actinomycetota bacterium]